MADNSVLARVKLDLRRNLGCYAMYVGVAVTVPYLLLDGNHHSAAWAIVAGVWCLMHHLASRDFYAMAGIAERALDAREQLQLDCAYYRSIVEGNWPDADAVIAMKRARQHG